MIIQKVVISMGTSSLDGYVPCDGYVLVVAEDGSYKSPNGVISNLERGGSLCTGRVIRLGLGVPFDFLDSDIMFFKYECLELQKDLWLVDFLGGKVRMYKFNN